MSRQAPKFEGRNFNAKMGFAFKSDAKPIVVPDYLEGKDKVAEKLSWLRSTVISELEAIKRDNSDKTIATIKYDGDINLGFPSSSIFSSFLLDGSVHQVFQDLGSSIELRAFSSTKEIVQEAKALFEQEFKENYNEAFTHPQLYVNVAGTKPPTFNVVTRRTSDSALVFANPKAVSHTATSLHSSLSLPNIIEEGDNLSKESMSESDIPATTTKVSDEDSVNKLGSALTKLSIFPSAPELESSTGEAAKEEKDHLATPMG
ncbi:hypothetical protein [Legionella beliardensis]|nr:hypothetical protein [Legionella beliardensis]